ncbi:MAG: hypothetical protein ACREQY_05745 [Candidatus Binatia bacterium]
MPQTRSQLPAYKNLLLVAGVMLVVLGIGNWAVGALRVERYADYLAQHPDPAGHTGDVKAALLEPPDDQREERNVSRAKLEFYELVRSGGRLMVVLGVVCLVAGLLTLGTAWNPSAPPGRSSGKLPIRHGRRGKGLTLRLERRDSHTALDFPVSPSRVDRKIQPLHSRASRSCGRFPYSRAFYIRTRSTETDALRQGNLSP